MSDVDYSGIPEHCRDTIQAYIERGRPMGGFLEAVFASDLVGAFGRADEINAANMRAYAVFLYNNAPLGCWGSRDKVRNWINDGGLQGRRERDENSGTDVD